MGYIKKYLITMHAKVIFHLFAVTLLNLLTLNSGRVSQAGRVVKPL